MEKLMDEPTADLKFHSASANVSILDPAFPMPQLNRTRRIWLYLPPSYATTTRQYPVLYMHDGQNLFDAQTSYAGEWGVDEILDEMRADCIVVGIDNGGLLRMQEYNVHDNDQQGKGEGKPYLEFIVRTLKPFIDKHYRTLPTRKNTFMAGSSMGGLISYFAGLYYPKVFGGVGVLSPSFWIVPGAEKELIQFAKRIKYSGQRYFFYAGGSESPVMVSGMQRFANLMQQLTKAEVVQRVEQDGQHNEQSWGRVFPDFIGWLLQT